MNHLSVNHTNGWSALQEPVHAVAAPAGYLRLLSALDKGWIVIEPVAFHPAAHQGLEGTYEFTLAGPESLSVETVTARAVAEIHALIRREGLRVRSHKPK